MKTWRYEVIFPPIDANSKCHGTNDVICRSCGRYDPGRTTMAHILNIPQVHQGHCRLYQEKP